MGVLQCWGDGMPLAYAAASRRGAGCRVADWRQTVHAGVGSAPFILGDLCCACPRLQRLSISRGKEHVMDSLAPIASLRELTDLVLHVTFREAGFEAISSGCEHLTRLEMSACPT